jgi:hypothetical protein
MKGGTAALTPAAATTTRITSPRHGATVGQQVAVEGMLAGLLPEQQVFVCLKSQAFGRLIYPRSDDHRRSSGDTARSAREKIWDARVAPRYRASRDGYRRHT